MFVVAQGAIKRQAGIASAIMAEISERFILSLKAPIGRVSAPDSIYPFGAAENDLVTTSGRCCHCG